MSEYSRLADLRPTSQIIKPYELPLRRSNNFLRVTRKEPNTRHQLCCAQPPYRLGRLAAISIVHEQTNITSRLVHRHGQPVLRTEGNRITLSLLLQFELRNTLRRLAIFSQFDEIGSTRDQAEGDQRLIRPGPVEGGEVADFATFRDSMVGYRVFVKAVDFVQGQVGVCDVHD